MKKVSKYAAICKAETPQGVSLTSPGLALSVPEIFQRMVLGQYPQFDDFSDYESDDPNKVTLDPLNCQGLTLDEAFALQSDLSETIKAGMEKKPVEPQNIASAAQKETEQAETITQ